MCCDFLCEDLVLVLMQRALQLAPTATCKPSNSGFTDCFGPSVLEEKSFGTSDRLSGTKPPGCMALVSGDTPPSGWSGEEGGDLDNRTFLMLPDLRASSAQELEDILYCTDFLVM